MKNIKLPESRLPIGFRMNIAEGIERMNSWLRFAESWENPEDKRIRKEDLCGEIDMGKEWVECLFEPCDESRWINLAFTFSDYENSANAVKLAAGEEGVHSWRTLIKALREKNRQCLAHLNA